MEPKVKTEAEVEEEANTESPIPQPASTSAPAATSMLPSRMFIITIHPNGTNSLSSILDLPNQPSTMAIDNLLSGAFETCFESSRPLTNRRRLISNTQKAIHRNLVDADYAWAHAFRQGKVLCANICAPWLINPTVLNIYPAPSHVMAQGEMSKARVPAPYASSALDGLFNYTNMNLSMLPDEYLRTWGMTFVIVHPVVLFPLIYRALRYSPLPDIQHSCALHMTYHWTVTLYKWAQADSTAPEPIIIDADALIEIPGHLASMFCQQTGLHLDLGLVRFEDAKAHREARLWNDKDYRDRFIRLTAEGRSTLDAVIELAKPGWVADFGTVAAGVIEDAVRAAQDDYMYLYDRRLQ
jgi:hypothetical protein